MTDKYITIYIDSCWDPDGDKIYFGSIGYTYNSIKFICGGTVNRNYRNPEAESILQLCDILSNKYSYDYYVIFTDSKISINQLCNKDGYLIVNNNKFIIRYTRGHNIRDYNWYCDRLASAIKEGDINDLWYSW